MNVQTMQRMQLNVPMEVLRSFQQPQLWIRPSESGAVDAQHRTLKALIQNRDEMHGQIESVKHDLQEKVIPLT